MIDATTGKVLFEKNPHERLFPASITKIATGIYAIENGNPDDIVTVSKKARYEEGTRVYLAEGEQVPLRKLEYGLLMNSGNDAATAIAEHLAGTTEQFAEQLNAFLQEKVGVQDTHFTNAHGLHDDNHYTTPYDMAKIAQYAMRNPIFREIVATKTLPWDGKEWKTTIVNHNKLLWSYEGTTGIKNGFTDQAQNTLVTSAKRGESEFIAVTMKAPSSNYAYKDVTKMLDYAFAHYETKQIAKAGDTFELASTSPDQPKQEFYTNQDLYVTVPLGSTIVQEVTANGQLVVQAGADGEEFPLQKKAPPRQVKSVQQTASPQVPGQSNAPYYALLIVWLLLNLFLLTVLIARIRNRRRLRRNRYRYERTDYRRTDWS
ncbi:hypothetical protein GCM10023228_10110 [Brevibacillus fulvus]